ncbi:MAG: haloacid dehalogenase-like hydrolase [Opitutales bacterium]
MPASPPESQGRLNSQNIVACVWDFDRTLVPGFMQAPLFKAYAIDERAFWAEVNALPAIYAERGIRVAAETCYLNHLISSIRNGPLRGLNNARLRELGAELRFFPGLPDLFAQLQERIRAREDFRRHDIRLEHYIISTGLAEMIRGSAIAPFVEGIFGCELVEDPLPYGFLRQPELTVGDASHEISQIGMMVDNTIKTRFIFEINKGSNKHPEIDVNAAMPAADRRVPVANMIYVADGPSDVPVFSVVRRFGGKAYAVYDPDSPEEFAQNDRLLQSGRIHAYGPADYREQSSTALWLGMHIDQICARIVADREAVLARSLVGPPRHLHRADTPAHPEDSTGLHLRQDEIFPEGPAPHAK